MLDPRLVRVLICSISLVVSGCAMNSVQEAQTAVSRDPPRRKAVLVNDFVLPSDAIIDRDFVTRLERKIDNYPLTNDVIEAMTARRVNDELVATIIVIMGRAGLNVRSGIQEETPKDGALVITGRLHAAHQGHREQRNPGRISASGSVVADVTMSEISDGTEKQLLTFTTPAQSGRRSGASAASDPPAFNEAISRVLTVRRSLDVNLSPDVQALARGLGHAVADKIVAYAVQQGWLNKANLPPPEDAIPEDSTQHR